MFDSRRRAGEKPKIETTKCVHYSRGLYVFLTYLEIIPKKYPVKAIMNNIVVALSSLVFVLTEKLFTKCIGSDIIRNVFCPFMFISQRRRLYMQIKSNLSTLMGAMRYSIKDVHEKTGLSRGTISNLYNDRATRIDYDTIARLCELFSCDVGSLLVVDNQSIGSEITEGNNE